MVNRSVSEPISALGAASDNPAPVRANGRLRLAFAIGFAVASIITALAVFLTTAAPASRFLAATGDLVLVVLGFNLLLILLLASAVGWRVWKLAVAGARGDAGVRLHRRFVGLFALAAVVPAIVVALFFGLLVTRGVENWFSSRVRTVVENAATVARSYVKEHVDYIHTRILLMADDLNRTLPAFESSRIVYSNFLAEQAAARDFMAVYVIDSSGRVMARAEGLEAPRYLAPPPKTLRDADREVQVSFDPDVDMGRGVFRLTAYPDAFLYVVRPMGEGVVKQLRDSSNAVTAYREADNNRVRIQIIFVLSYVGTALLVLTGAVWVGMTAATQIAAPVARLVKAADRVASGDLDARVQTLHDPEEIAVLSRAFNRMTSDLQAQQMALRAAGDEAESRRRFIEAVLSGVSAGVIGLDEHGRISAMNASALKLIGIAEHAALGRPLDDVAPELAAVAASAKTGGEADADVDVVRRAETRRLRVRASRREDGGAVLTFDDITRLVTAQRNAAWRDVARRIAHEIKNPLTPIQLSAERLRRKYRGEIKNDIETFDRCTDTIVRQVGDIGRMVDEFSAFARMPAPKFGEEDAAELLRQAVFAQRVAYPDVACDLIEPAPSTRFTCDGRMVGQALANVLKNAGEAVAARMAADPTIEGRIQAQLKLDGGFLTFEIEDNGVGLPTKDRDRLTEPYVTTREKGTGLGLAIVKRILEEHGGELTLGDATNPPGARTVLKFPRTAEAHEGATAA